LREPQRIHPRRRRGRKLAFHVHAASLRHDARILGARLRERREIVLRSVERQRPRPPARAATGSP
jgi:hypothetical protein